MQRLTWVSLTLLVLSWGCGDDGAGGPSDAGDTCPESSSEGELAVEIGIEAGVGADVRVLRGTTELGTSLTATGSQRLAAGRYSVAPHRVRAAGELVGPAFQGAVDGEQERCVRAGRTTQVRVVYAREPGSEKLWLTQSNGDDAQVMAFDASQLAARGEQVPSVKLAPKLDSAGPIAVDGKGQLWIASGTGKLVAYAASRLGTSSTSAPEISIDGPSVCEPVVPCGPRALAFDASGALWVATTSRIVKLAAESLEQSGQPLAAVTIASADAGNPRALAFDAHGNLWVADATGAVVKFEAGQLTHDIDTDPAGVVVYAQQPGPVMIGLGEPEGLVFDRDGNLWVGYFGGNALVRFKPSELAARSASDNPLIPSLYLKIGAEALITDLALDEGGNLWLPGRQGTIYFIAKAQLSAETPEIKSLLELGAGQRRKTRVS